MDGVLGKTALDCKPAIYQAFVKRPRNVKAGIEFDRKLYVARRIFEKTNNNTYVCSLSSRTIVYKGMFMVKQLRGILPRICRMRASSQLSRSSTQDSLQIHSLHGSARILNRLMVHNGEIDTIRGNVNKMSSREETMQGGVFGEDLYKVLPAVDHWASDSRDARQYS